MFRVSPFCTIYIVWPEVEFWLLPCVFSPLGTIKLSPVYIRFGFAILFSSTSLSTVVLYLIASSVNVSPLCIIIVVVPPASGLLVLSGKGISELLFKNTSFVTIDFFNKQSGIFDFLCHVLPF